VVQFFQAFLLFPPELVVIRLLAPPFLVFPLSFQLTLVILPGLGDFSQASFKALKLPPSLLLRVFFLVEGGPNICGQVLSRTDSEAPS